MEEKAVVESENGEEGIETLSSELRIHMAFACGIGAFWVVFLWGFWEEGFQVLGFNATVFWVCVAAAFARLTPGKRLFCRENLKWSLPMLLISLSYSIFDNPFIKFFHLAIHPLGFGFLYHSYCMQKSAAWGWGFPALFAGLARAIAPISYLKKAFGILVSWLSNVIPGDRSILIRIFLGFALLCGLALLVVIPLLSSADPQFARMWDDIFKWIEQYLSIYTLLGKAVAFCVISSMIVAAALIWPEPSSPPQRKDSSKDSIIGGILIGGVLLLYCLFLLLQFKQLWVAELPIEFAETERLVKTGFWQLLFLSFLNIVLFITYFFRTNRIVEALLQAFSVASLLLLASAAHRMALYVIYYGFSYEKFFAAFATLFSGVLLLYLVYISLFRKDRDAVKFGVGLFFVMYSLVSVFPVEQFIFRANLKLAQMEDSRINLHEMKMLSSDVFALVVRYQEEGVLAGPLPAHSKDEAKRRDWSGWIEQRKKQFDRKSWYELNASKIYNHLAAGVFKPQAS